MDKMMRVVLNDGNAAVYDIRDVNDSFAYGSLRIMYLGENRNGSYFTKDAVVSALPSLKNVPIVCHWDEDDGQIGGHDIELKKTDDGGLRLKTLTEPCGVVPESAQFCFETASDVNGNEHEYLVAKDVILWKRQEVFNHIVDDLGGHVDHSMEITVKEGGDGPNGTYAIRKFEFTALCLLEKYEPCFEGSELALYTAQHFKEKLAEMMAELKSCFAAMTTVDTPNGDEDKELREGGEEVLEKEMNALEENALVAEDAQAETPDESVNEEPAAEAEEAEAENAGAGEYALESNVHEELHRAVSEEQYVHEWGEGPRYFMIDYDADRQEVYCYDTADWLLYGFAYTMNGDAVTVDFTSKKRMKFDITDFEGGDSTDGLQAIFTALEEKLTALFNAHDKANSDYRAASEKVNDMEHELGELRKYKADNENAKAEAAKEAVFGSFADLAGVEAFEKLREDSSAFDAEALEEKCYALRGRYGTQAKGANAQPKLVVPRGEEKTEPYGGIVEKYAKKA